MNSPAKKMRDFCEITSSKRIFASEYVESGVPFYRSKEVIERQAGKIDVSTEIFISESRFSEIESRFGAPQQGDLLLTSVGTLGVPYVVGEGERFYFKDGNLTWFRKFNKLDSRYLYYWLLSPIGKAELKKATIGSSQSAYTITLLGELSIRPPTLDIQHQVIESLSAYDDLIAINQHRIALLEDASRRLYCEWFVQLRFPGHESVAAVDGVPQGWKMLCLGDVCEAIGGGTPSTARPEYWGGDVIWITPTDVTRNDCVILLDSEKKITEAGLSNSSAKMLLPETILMTSRASIGFFALMEREVCTNQGFISVIPKQEGSRMFLLWHLKSRVEEMIGLATGSTFKELSKKTFRALPVVWPDAGVLNLFEHHVYPLIQQVRLIKKQNAQLIQARDLILPKLMSGQLDVSAIALPDEVAA